jgi:hypothetical protein
MATAVMMPAKPAVVMVMIARTIVGRGEMVARATSVSVFHISDIDQDISKFKIYLTLIFIRECRLAKRQSLA